VGARNGFLNLALPYLGFSEPVAPAEMALTIGERRCTLWDRIEVVGPLTLRQLIAFFESEHNLKLEAVSCDISMIYCEFMPKPLLMDTEYGRSPSPCHPLVVLALANTPEQNC
jgi:hypothetical protein